MYEDLRKGNLTPCVIYWHLSVIRYTLVQQLRSYRPNKVTLSPYISDACTNSVTFSHVSHAFLYLYQFRYRTYRYRIHYCK